MWILISNYYLAGSKSFSSKQAALEEAVLISTLSVPMSRLMNDDVVEYDEDALYREVMKRRKPPAN